MTKAEIIKALEPFPDTMDVFVDTCSVHEAFRYNLVDEVFMKEIPFMDSKLKAKDTVIIIELF